LARIRAEMEAQQIEQDRRSILKAADQRAVEYRLQGLQELPDFAGCSGRPDLTDSELKEERVIISAGKHLDQEILEVDPTDYLKDSLPDPNTVYYKVWEGEEKTGKWSHVHETAEENVERHPRNYIDLGEDCCLTYDDIVGLIQNNIKSSFMWHRMSVGEDGAITEAVRLLMYPCLSGSQVGQLFSPEQVQQIVTFVMRIKHSVEDVKLPQAMSDAARERIHTQIQHLTDVDDVGRDTQNLAYGSGGLAELNADDEIRQGWIDHNAWVEYGDHRTPPRHLDPRDPGALTRTTARAPTGTTALERVNPPDV